MNFVRRIVARGRRGVNHEENSMLQQERSLCIQHLRKLFLEFLHPPTPLSPEQQELKLYIMLPLFLKAFSESDPSLLSEKFGDALQFAGHTSKLMVTEIQRRAANKSKEQASKDIIRFLAFKEEDIENRGWNLMCTLSVLTEGEAAIVECMVAAALQSILVKCTKLFFVLPSGFGDEDKLSQIQKVLIATLVKLCYHPITAKELIRTDDLASLFDCLTCSVHPHHMIWRSGVSEVLTSITRHCFTWEVINYIHEKSCIALSLANIQSICETDPLAVVEMFVTLICVIKDSADVSAVLLEHFYDCHGYKFLSSILLLFSKRVDKSAKEACRNLVILISSLVMTGYTELLPLQTISTPFQGAEYLIPKPSGVQGLSIRNLQAFQVLLDVFQETNDTDLSLHILGAVQSIFNSDNANYFILDSLHPLAQFIQKIPEKTDAVQKDILKLVEFVALHLRWVPSQELVAMTILFKDPDSTAAQCAVLHTLIRLINHDGVYKDILRTAGLMDVMVVALNRYSASLKASCEVNVKDVSPPSTPMDQPTTDYLFLLMEALRLLVENNEANASFFRQHGGSRCVHNLVPFANARPYALRIIQQLIVDGGHDDLGTLLGLMHSTSVTDIKLKVDVLSSLIRIFEMSQQTRPVFQEVGGFVYVVSVLVSLEGSLAEPPSHVWKDAAMESILELVWLVFHVLTSAMKDEPVNKIIFMDEVRFKGLIDTVKLLGCFPGNRQTLPSCVTDGVFSKRQSSSFGGSGAPPLPVVLKNSRKYAQIIIFKTILSMARGMFESWEMNISEVNWHLLPSSRKIPKIFHPKAVNGLIELLPYLYEDESVKNEFVPNILLYMVSQIQHLMGLEINQQLMCEAGLPYLLLQKCQEAFIDELHPLNGPMTKLFERLASQTLYPKVLREFLRLGSPLCSKSAYAVLRPPECFDKVDCSAHAHDDVNIATRQQLMSLHIFDGDIKLSCDDFRGRSNSPRLWEENEFTSVDDDSGLDVASAFSGKQLRQMDNASVSSASDMDAAFDEASSIGTNDTGMLSAYSPGDEALHRRGSDDRFVKKRGSRGSIPSAESTLISVNADVGHDESLPNGEDERNVSESDLIEPCLPDFDPVDKVESMIEDDFEFDSQIVSECDISKEIARVCERFEGRALPQHLVKSVVSLTTPRDVLSTSPLEPPAFIEFDMSEDGYACLFVPALTPQNIHGQPTHQYRPSGSSSSLNMAPLSVVTVGERTFPPPTGFTFSAWVFIESAPAAPTNSSVVLLTVERRWINLVSKSTNCNILFSLYLDLPKQHIVILTDDQVEGAKSNTEVRVQCPEIFEGGKWNHVCAVLVRNVLKTSTVSLHVNGVSLGASKIKYIPQGGSSSTEYQLCKTCAYIGTHPKHCHLSELIWRLGPVAVFEDALSDDNVLIIYKLGPGYIGCFQAPCSSDFFEEDGAEQVLPQLIAEEKLLFSLNPHNLTITTLSKLRSQCPVSDLDLLAEEMSISPEDKHTPIQVLPNTALHLQGPCRAMGMFLIGSAGLRIFCPQQVASSFVSIGGMPILLCLVAMVSLQSELYASLKALTCILQSSRIARREMNRVHGYEIVAFLLKKKKNLLNTHILHLVFSLVGTVRSDRETSTIPNITAFNDVLCDFQIWHNAPAELERSLFSHFYELITQGHDQQRNIGILRNLDIVSKLMHIVQDGDVTDAALNTIANVLSVLLCRSQRTSDLLKLGQYLASTLPLCNTTEADIEVDPVYADEKSSGPDASSLRTLINQRNALLDVLIHLLLGSGTSGLDHGFCEQMYTVLGFDWLMLFFAGNVHKTTVMRGARLLFSMLLDQSALNHFLSGLMNGGWLEGAEVMTKKKSRVAAGFNVSDLKPGDMLSEYEVSYASCRVKGLPLLMFLLEEHADMTELYFSLLSLLLKNSTTGMQLSSRLNIETLHVIFWPSVSLEKIHEERLVKIYWPEAAHVILHMVRKMMNRSNTTLVNEEDDPATILVNFLQFLYSNLPEFEAFCLDKSFLRALAATLFPFEDEHANETANEPPGEDGGQGTSVSLTETSLTHHQCRATVVDFLKRIVVNTLQKTSGKISGLTDALFDSPPLASSMQQQHEFQTDITLSVISEFLPGKNAKLVSASESLSSRLLSNSVVFASKLVDRLWIGAFHHKDIKVIRDYVVYLVQNIEDFNLNVDSIFHSLNRLLLYQVSRPTSRITEQTNLLELLHFLTMRKDVIFSHRNRDLEFVACLCYWLLVVGLQSAVASKMSRSFSELLNESDDQDELDDTKEDEDLRQVVSDGEGQGSDAELRNMITAATERVWNIFYLHKKESIEEVFRTQAVPSFLSYEKEPIGIGACRAIALDLKSAKPLLGDQAARMWISFVNSEEKRKNEVLSVPRPAPTKKLSKLTKTLKREKTVEELFSVQETLAWMALHLKTVTAMVKIEHASYSQDLLLKMQSAEKRWSNLEMELVREAGVWGPNLPNPLDKWMLDDIEGPLRQRKRLTKNDNFYLHYPYIEQEKEHLLMKYRLASSSDSKLLYDICQKYIAPARNGSEVADIPSKDSPFSYKPRLFSLDGLEAADSGDEVNTQTIIQLLENGEKIYSMYRCARVRGLDSAEGLFLFGRNHFYVVDGFTLLSTDGKQNDGSQSKEIKDIDALPEGTHEPLIPVAKGNFTLKRSFSKWPFQDIKEVHKRRYLLQNIAIEVFSTDGSNHLLVFPKQTARDKVYNRIVRVSPVLASGQESIAGMKSDTDVEAGQGLFGSFIGEKSVTQRWVRGEMTNFQYLTYLNTLADRSYNDLMQYPIFPWILADYDSEVLDLTRPSTFRDLSKPMGAQGEERLKQYRKRFREWEDPAGKTPAYYYGTHYSSAMIVASYLIRLEPFTQHFLRLQGGHFDLPDRLFHSIKEAWVSASEANMADIKELIPEFFYLPEFLTNANNFEFGRKQSGDELGDVALPPWAKGDCREFIRVHREALECDYVSAHLHEWIDLVFGYKQQGQAAVEADNVFHHLFYEKAVDLELITDPLERKATIGFINNFGQMPKQLFKKAHPSKKSLKSHDPAVQTGTLPVTHSFSLNDKVFFHHLSSLVPTVQPIRELKAPVGQILIVDKSFTATEANKALFPGTSNQIGWGYGDFSLRYYGYDGRVLAVFEDVFTGQTLCAVCLDSTQFITGGTCTAVCLWAIEQKAKDKGYKLGLRTVLYGHENDVLCLAVSTSYNILVSGSQDKSCIIWDLRKLAYTRRLGSHAGPVSCVVINHSTGDIVTCAGTHIYVWTINGQLIVQENTSPAISGQILCCLISEFNEWDEENVIVTGSVDGFVKMWGIEFYDASGDSRKTHGKSVGRRAQQMLGVDAKAWVEPPHVTSSEGSGALVENPFVGDCERADSDDKEYVYIKYGNRHDRAKKDWRRRLVLRQKLTMHTAFSRTDNVDPASVTAVAVSKDHRKLYVGDSRGRVFCWSVSDAVGRIADHWVRDDVADKCTGCSTRFSFAERKHHCRNCGNVFCHRCSRFESPIVHLRIFKAVRVCSACYSDLKRRPSMNMAKSSL